MSQSHTQMEITDEAPHFRILLDNRVGRDKSWFTVYVNDRAIGSIATPIDDTEWQFHKGHKTSDNVPAMDNIVVYDLNCPKERLPAVYCTECDEFFGTWSEGEAATHTNREHHRNPIDALQHGLVVGIDVDQPDDCYSCGSLIGPADEYTTIDDGTPEGEELALHPSNYPVNLCTDCMNDLERAMKGYA